MTPAPSLNTVLSRIGETQAPLPAAAAVLVGLAALAAVSLQEIWLVARHVNVIAHEGAHAVIGSAAGRKVRGVTLRSNADGKTRLDPGKMPGNITIGVVGYLGPSAIGLGAAKLIQLGHSVAVLWRALLLLAVLLTTMRNFFGILAVLLTGWLLYVVVRYASVGAETVAACGLSWFLLLSGVRMVVDDGIRAGDAGILAGITHIRPVMWVRLWLVGTAIALGVGGVLLL